MEFKDLHVEMDVSAWSKIMPCSPAFVPSPSRYFLLLQTLENHLNHSFSTMNKEHVFPSWTVQPGRKDGRQSTTGIKLQLFEKIFFFSFSFSLAVASSVLQPVLLIPRKRGIRSSFPPRNQREREQKRFCSKGACSHFMGFVNNVPSLRQHLSRMKEVSALHEKSCFLLGGCVGGY